MQMAQTPLHVSAGYNRIEIVGFLLSWRGPEKVELETKNMVHLIYSLLQLNQYCFFTFLQSSVKHVFLPHIMHLRFNWQYGETPLHMAAKNGCNEAAKLLLAHGAFVEARANVNFCILCFFCYSTSIWARIAGISSLTFGIYLAEWDDSLTPCCLALSSSWRLLNCQYSARI